MPVHSVKNKEETAMEPSPKSGKSSVVSGQLKKQIEKKKKNARKNKPERGVVFIKNLPHGFFEEQIQKYFEQFGRITRLRLVRSKQTGQDKGYAFIEFLYPEVAEEAAKAMNNYLMFNKLVKAAYISPEEQKHNYFKTNVRAIRNSVGKIQYVSKKTQRRVRRMSAVNNWLPDNYVKRLSKGNKKVQKIKDAIGSLGLDPDFVSDIVPRLDKLKDLMDDKRKELEANAAAVQGDSDEDSSNENASSKNSDNSPNVGNIILLNKRRSSSAEKIEKPKKKKKKIQLKDLFENTIQDDSTDEDFILSPGGDNGFDNSDNSDSDVSSNDEDQSPRPNDKLSKTSVKLSKSKNSSKLDEIIKRNQNSGGVQKPKRKKKNKTTVAKEKLKKVAQEIAHQGVPQHLKKKQKKGKITA